MGRWWALTTVHYILIASFLIWDRKSVVGCICWLERRSSARGRLPFKRIAGAKSGRKSKAPEPLTSKSRASSSVFREKKTTKKNTNTAFLRTAHTQSDAYLAYLTPVGFKPLLLFPIPFVDTDPKFLTGLAKKCSTFNLFEFDPTGSAFPSAHSLHDGMKMMLSSPLETFWARKPKIKTKATTTRISISCFKNLGPPYSGRVSKFCASGAWVDWPTVTYKGKPMYGPDQEQDERSTKLAQRCGQVKG